MLARISFAALFLMTGVAFGFALGRGPADALAQGEQARQTAVRGHAVASSSAKPPGERVVLKSSEEPRLPFKLVPAGRKLVLTDVMYHAQGSLRQDVTINVADEDPATGTHEILFQVRISPGESQDVHLCSGYVIPAGHALAAFTNAGIEPGQLVSLDVSGHLTAE